MLESAVDRFSGTVRRSRSGEEREHISMNRPGDSRGREIGRRRFSLLPVKYTDELKARAVELVIHAQADPDTANGAITRVANELGLSKETLRVWVRKHKDSGKATPAESVDLEAENRRLRAELAEAKRANEILKRASACLP